MSPPTSVSAFLQSDIPPPVRSRRSLIIDALTSISLVLVRRGRRLGIEHAAARRHLDARAIPTRRHVDDSLAGLLALLTARARRLLEDLVAEDRGVGDLGGEQLDRADRVVVARDHVVDLVR